MEVERCVVLLLLHVHRVISFSSFSWKHTDQSKHIWSVCHIHYISWLNILFRMLNWSNSGAINLMLRLLHPAKLDQQLEKTQISQLLWYLESRRQLMYGGPWRNVRQRGETVLWQRVLQPALRGSSKRIKERICSTLSMIVVLVRHCCVHFQRHLILTRKDKHESDGSGWEEREWSKSRKFWTDRWWGEEEGVKIGIERDRREKKSRK